MNEPRLNDQPPVREPSWSEVAAWAHTELLRTQGQLERADDARETRRLQGDARTLRRLMNLPNILATTR